MDILELVRQKQVNPCGSLASQSSLSSELQTNEKLSQKQIEQTLSTIMLLPKYLTQHSPQAQGSCYFFFSVCLD